MDLKRPLSAVLAVTMAASLPAGASADAASAANSISSAAAETQTAGAVKKNDKYTYEITDKGNIIIRSLTKKAIDAKGVVKIPSKIGGRKVKLVSEDCNDFFRKNWKKIKVVDFPKGVEYESATDYYCCLSDGLGMTDTLYFNDDVFEGGAYTHGEYTYKRNQKVVIRCFKNSKTYKWAVRNNLRYSLKDKGLLGDVIFKDSSSISKNSVKLSWFRVKNAAGYQVYVHTKGIGGWKLAETLKGIDNTTFRDTDLRNGETTKYLIRAYKNSGNTIKQGPKTGGRAKAVTAPGVPEIRPIDIEASYDSDYYDNDFVAFSYDESVYDLCCEVYDEDTGEWCSAFYNNGIFTGEHFDKWINYLRVECFYNHNPYSDRWGSEPIEAGKTYRVRLRYSGVLRIGENVWQGAVVKKTCKGKPSNELTLTAKKVVKEYNDNDR